MKNRLTGDRVTLHQRQRKLNNAVKRNTGRLQLSALWRSKQKANIPNDWLLADIAKQREHEKELAEKNKVARKAAAEKKKRDTALGTKPASTESALPAGMGAPAPVPSSTSNAILLDASTRRVWREIKQVVEESDIILDVRDPLGFEMRAGKLDS